MYYGLIDPSTCAQPICFLILILYQIVRLQTPKIKKMTKQSKIQHIHFVSLAHDQ